MRVAVVGAGPSGFYAAARLLDAGFEVDMIERLPTPWGLVRLGVAPDHPKIKAVSRVFEEIASRPGFRLFGNVEVGRDLGHDELVRMYDAVVYAVGASSDRQLEIPGEDLPGSLAAREFVAWYNGDPDSATFEPDLSCSRAVVVGNGNVALDLARMLVLDEAALAETDVADGALEALAASRISEVVVLGRRGPAQASFTNPELRELGELAGVRVVVEAADLTGDSRNLDTLRAWAASPARRAPRTIRLRFLASPVAIVGEDRVEAIEIVRNRLESQPDGTAVAVPTDDHETISCGLVLRSIGYRGNPIAGLPFDDRTGVIPNERGRVAAGVYCTGWIKRGPTGIIGTNKKDSNETVETILADAAAGALQPPDGSDTLDELLAARGVTVVDLEGWRRIDAIERARGEAFGRPRRKLCTWDGLLATARADEPVTVRA